MWTILAIALVAIVVALVLAYVLKAKLTDEDVWQELVDPNAPAENSDSSNRPLPEVPFSAAQEFSRPGVETMRSGNTNTDVAREVELRRSSRLQKPLPLIVLGTNRRGESFEERTSALSFNLHGCRYSSRHECQPESWVTLQVTGTDGPAAPPVRARVRSVYAAQTPRELCQVGVELETPGNVWGIAQPPEDWQRVLGATATESRAAAAVAPAVDPPSPPVPYLQRTAAPPDRRSEVAVFPSPVTPEPPPVAAAPAPAKETAAAVKSVTFTPEQLLQALQGKLQLAAEHAVDEALAVRLDETVRQALEKIEEGWKANLRQTEEFSAARLSEVQSRWERELVVYRSRAEEISRRVEALAASSRQGLIELQKFAERIKNETEPQFDARLEQSIARASSSLETRAKELAEQHQNKISELAQAAALQNRTQMDEILAEARALAAAAKVPPSPSGVPEERLDSLVNSARESTLNRMEERVSDIWMQFEQQQDLARQRADEMAQQVEALRAQLDEAKTRQEHTLGEIRTLRESAAANAAPERLDSALKLAKEQIFNHLEWRLGEISGRADQQHNAVQQRAEELTRRVEGLAGETGSARTQFEQSSAEIHTLLAAHNSGISQQQLDAVLTSAREQLLNHFEWRLGETSVEFQQRQDAAQQRSEELAKRLEMLAGEIRSQLEDSRAQTEETRPYDLATIEQSADRASKEFELSVARISDRQLIRLLQQKQALSAEALLELEARATETRANLQKAANTTLDEFQQRVDAHIDQVIAEATERVASSLASLDAESRAACDARRRELELQVARAAEHSTAEFRSGIKAFLYSCLVAAVSAVDEHAQSTLAGLAKDAHPEPLAIEAPRDEQAGNSPNGGSLYGDPRKQSGVGSS